MRMNDVRSITWTKIAEIPTDDFSIDGIAKAINEVFGEPFPVDIGEAIAEGYIQICDDGIILWMS